MLRGCRLCVPSGYAGGGSHAATQNSAPPPSGRYPVRCRAGCRGGCRGGRWPARCRGRGPGGRCRGHSPGRRRASQVCGGDGEIDGLRVSLAGARRCARWSRSGRYSTRPSNSGRGHGAAWSSGRGSRPARNTPLDASGHRGDGVLSPPRSIAARIASSKLSVVRRAQTAEPRQGQTAPLNSVA
jgi:hypothetical protein